jgi:endoribonuclease Dicer
MHVGLRGPSNIFGHPTDEVLGQLDGELRRWDEGIADPVTKIVFGHFPMSFTTTSETGKRVEDVMASNDVTAYVCGHLHTTFGRRLYKHHKYVSFLK